MLGKAALVRYALVATKSGHEAPAVVTVIEGGIGGPILDVSYPHQPLGRPIRTHREIREEQKRVDRQRQIILHQQRAAEAELKRQQRIDREAIQAALDEDLRRLSDERAAALAAHQAHLNEQMARVQQVLDQLRYEDMIRQEEEEFMFLVACAA